MSRPVPMSGRRFGYLVAVAAFARTEHGALMWWCVCDCGSAAIIRGDRLRDGATRTCGAAVHRRRPEQLHADAKVTYLTAHKRVYRERGPARDQACALCPAEAANEWSWNHNPIRALQEPEADGNGRKTPRWYSPDPADYMPLCWQCHRNLDAAFREVAS